MFSVSVARHGNGVYRPGKSGGDSESTPDTKPVAWAASGRRGGTCGKSEIKNHKEVGYVVERMFMRVSEVAEALDVSKPYAYKLIRELNEELKQMGCITIAGRVDRKFFFEKFYGVHKNN